ncbi:unnamed protein product [Eruca vesicaria subsp. sativa]|uniref:Uncharacterized protein n=1 Tax=Eruca vesicaria subsp. sativa TaxID=29727 RepID=A0ABC8KPS6_ERUVS|nr:unnamed protein product [Eruca vesicaria subsp. sativa]
MPSVPTKLLLLLLLVPSLTPYHSGLSSHRLKPLQKSDWRGADFEISVSSPTQCSGGVKHLTHAGSEESLEPDGDETGYINQTVNEESDTKNELESATEGFGNSTLGSVPSKSSDDEDKDENLTTVTAPVVLIPAIKGSREKHGLTLRKTSVSWADDVYDPPPSIASHTRNKKQQQKSKSKDSHKKTGKKGQKGKDSSSSRSGKDKKQASRKHSREKFDWVTQMPIVAASS